MAQYSTRRFHMLSTLSAPTQNRTKKSSLWNFPLFQPKATMAESFAHTVNLVWSCLDASDKESPLQLEEGRLSLEQAIDDKDVDAMLEFRAAISDDVISKRGCLF